MTAKHNSPNDNLIEKKGYGIDELRYRRAYALARYEMAKIGVIEQMGAVRSGFGSGFAGKGIAGKILGSLNYLDWALLAFRAASKIAKWRRR